MHQPFVGAGLDPPVWCGGQERHMGRSLRAFWGCGGGFWVRREAFTIRWKSVMIKGNEKVL
ncbi:MAG: hypothetical protein ACI3W5_12535, partial [Faecousia sp.]